MPDPEFRSAHGSRGPAPAHHGAAVGRACAIAAVLPASIAVGAIRPVRDA